MKPLNIAKFTKPNGAQKVTNSQKMDEQIDKNIDKALQKYFGMGQFRPQQKEIIKTSLKNQDTVVIMPTGGGKSLCFQIPPIVSEKLTIVISPLISLMQNHIDHLNKVGVVSYLLNSSLNQSERKTVYDLLKQDPPEMFLLYVTPEMIVTTGFQSHLQRLNNNNQLSLFAIDEAHCISAWGHDFRPVYLELSTLKKNFPTVPVMALTATATPIVRDDIIKSLHLNNPKCFSSSFDRPNIYFSVIYKDLLQNPIEKLMEICSKDGGGIIYCSTREECENVANKAKLLNFEIEVYHAGLKQDMRSDVQKRWECGKCKVVVATIAFGMGIDRRDVRFVVHWNLPGSIEGYMQEAGRAGRDGKPAESIIMFERKDIERLQSLKTEKANSVAEYCGNCGCRRSTLLKYFGEKLIRNEWKGERCCDLCCDSKRVKSDLEALENFDFYKKSLSTKSETSQTTGSIKLTKGNPFCSALAVKNNRI
ncbi:ATP-dependent DNA helicase [Entamoeba marina]